MTSSARQRRASQRAGLVNRSLEPDYVAEILVRLGFSFLLIPQSSLPLDDDERMRELARTLVAPVLGV